jgi:hypothetical protein
MTEKERKKESKIGKNDKNRQTERKTDKTKSTIPARGSGRSL